MRCYCPDEYAGTAPHSHCVRCWRRCDGSAFFRGNGWRGEANGPYCSTCIAATLVAPDPRRTGVGATLTVAALLAMATACSFRIPGWGTVDVTPRPPVVTEPTPTPCPGQPGGVPCPEGEETQYESTHGSRLCWCGTPVPPYVTPTSTPTATPPAPPTVAPTSTPTPQPTAAPMDPFACLVMESVPVAAVPVFTGKPCRRRDGFVPVNDPLSNTDGCIRDWSCKDGDERFRPVKRIGDSLWFGGPNGVHRCFDGEAPGPEYICDTGRVAIDAYGRPLLPDGTVAPCEGECVTKDEGERWRHSSICAPVRCESTPTPVPTVGPTPGGPTPTPPIVTGPVPDFVLGFTNVSDKCRNFKDCRCQPDGAHRFKGHLKNGKFVQNTVDRDHWFLAVEHRDRPPDKTPEEWAQILQDHRDTYELGGGDEWIVSTGIRHEWRYRGEQERDIRVAEKLGNPYQAEFTAACGATVEARGCMEPGAYSCPDAFRGELREDHETREEKDKHYSEFDCRPEHRRLVPGAGGCGPWKTYEVR